MISTALPVVARRWLRRTLAGALLPLLALPATAATYHQSITQNGSGDWHTLAHWNTASNGSGSSPSAITSADDFVGNTNGRILRTGTGVNDFGGGSLTLGPANHELNVRSFTSVSTVPNLITLGTPRIRAGYNSSNLAITLWNNQSGATEIINHTHSAANFQVAIGTLTGAGNINLTGSATGLLRLTLSNAADYSGVITLTSGRLEFMNPVTSAGSLVAANPGDVILNHAVNFGALTVAGTVYSPGTYGAAALGFSGTGSVTVGSPSQTWYLTTKQSGSQNWTEAFLFNWNSSPHGTGVSSSTISIFDDFVSQAAAGEIRTPNAASTFGGGSLTLAHTSKLTLRTPANAVSTIPAFITAGTPIIANGIGTIRQNLALGDWENFSGTTRLSASAGRSLGFDIGNLTGSGGLQTHNGGSFFLSLANGSGYTGTLDHASGSLRFESPVATAGAFTIGSAATVHLDQPAYFTSFSVAGSAKPAGIHKYTTLNAQHPANFPSGSVSGLVGVYSPDATGPAQMFGVNLSGPETRNPANFPGTHGSQWSYPSAAAFDYYHARGLDLVRIPFRWERMQTALGSGVLNAAELARMDAAIALAAARGMKVIPVMHNQARWVPGSNHDGHLIGTGPVTLAHYAEVWRLLADHYKGNTAIHGYGIMDAPHNTNGTWPAIAQAAINAIRTVDLGTYVLVSGDNWSNAAGWVANNANLNVQDPVGRLIYEARCFFDADGSGTYAQSYDASGASATTGVTRATEFVQWLQARNAKGFIGAYGVPAGDSRWLATLGNFLTYLQANGVSGTYWAGGPGSVGSSLSVEPTSNYTVDKPQMSVIGNGTGTPPPPPPPPVDPALVVSYDFPAGDTIAPKNGWVFSNPNWPMAQLPGGGGNSMPFTYGAEPVGEDGWSEHRFAMPASDEFWIRLRWHVPANYHHRVDTYLEIANAYAAGWRVGDIVRGRDGTSQAAISRITSTVVWLRDAPNSYSNGVWVGQLTNLTRSTTLNCTLRRREPANNKLLAIWCDDYSIHGTGSTIVWQTDHWTDNTENVVLTVGYSVGNNTSTGGVIDGGILLRPADYGTYMDIIFHGKFATSPTANNGIIRSWVRKEGQANYTQFHNITNANIKKPTTLPAAEQFWKRGYLMGWSNSGFDQTTTFHLSKIEYYNARPAVLNP